MSIANGREMPVAICGAGVAGLAVAIRLSELGFRPAIFEARPHEAVTSEGEFFTLAPNGMNALRAIGCFDKALEAGVNTRAIEFFNGRGRSLARADQSDHARVFGAPSITLRRGVLAKFLLDRARELHIQMCFGRKVSRLSFKRDAATLDLDDGSKFDAGAVVGADGLRSTVRKDMFPDYPKPVFTGLVGVGGLVGADVPDTNGEMRMVFGANSFFGYLKEGNGPVYWFSSYTASQEETKEPASPSDMVAMIRQRHAADPFPVPTILDQVTALDRSYPIFDMPPLPKWSRERVVLIGDAAHAVGPHAGQGASMALEDALVLADCLNHEHDFASAFARYEGLRRPRIEDVVRLTARNKGSKETSGKIALIIRDLILPFVLPIGIRAGRKLFSFRADIDPLANPIA